MFSFPQPLARGPQQPAMEAGNTTRHTREVEVDPLFRSIFARIGSISAVSQTDCQPQMEWTPSRRADVASKGQLEN
jgi:hypothetical protein